MSSSTTDLTNAVLVISPWLEGWFMPALVAEAGLHCDLVSVCPSFQLSGQIRQLELVEAASALAPAALKCWQQFGPYKWVISMSDSLLGELAQRALLEPSYRCLLPLTPAGNTAHLHSKIGLSRAFSAAGIPTPAWRVATDPASARQQAQALGWPLLLKQDASAGGSGVWRCRNSVELEQAATTEAGKPFLLQQWIDGDLYSVEGLYEQGVLRAYALSAVEACMRDKGPSTQRLYGLPADHIPELKPILERIGVALGLHGFTNISLIQKSDHEPPQFFECDVRPNAWIRLDNFLGGDFARALRDSTSQPAKIRACYADLPTQSISPFLKQHPSGPATNLDWPYPPPNETPKFLEAVLASGQLNRAPNKNPP